MATTCFTMRYRLEFSWFAQAISRRGIARNGDRANGSRQRNDTKKIGRPLKQSERLRNAILALVRDGQWSGRASLKELERLLSAAGYADLPSSDTLGRMVDQLFRETGIRQLRRIKRRRRKPHQA